jgi:hypothetical protein
MPSEIIIRSFRLNLSAQTPQKGEIINIGRNPTIVMRVIIIPDCVFNVMCHKIANCTIDEPKRVTVCPAMNNAVLSFQFFSMIKL